MTTATDTQNTSDSIDAKRLAELLGYGSPDPIYDLIWRGKLTEGYHYWKAPEPSRFKYLFSTEIDRFAALHRQARHWESVPYQEVSQALLKQCRTKQPGYSPKRNAAIKKISTQLGLEWNDTLQWMDFHYAGWRGYYVGTPEERIAS